MSAAIGSANVLEAAGPLILKRGKSKHLRSNNGLEFVAKPLQDWLQHIVIIPIQIIPDSL